MGKKGGGAGENSKKAVGNARKKEAEAAKTSAAEAKNAAVEDAKWEKGAKNSSKKEAEAAKKEEAARKKLEREALLKEEEASNPGRSAAKNAKTATKKTRGLDLSQLDDSGSGSGKDNPSKQGPSSLNATGIDNALDALSLTGKSAESAKIEKHPERRFKAAYAAFEERRLKEMDDDGSGQGLRLQQRKDKVKKEFEKSAENPFNQVHARFDTSRDELADIRQREKDKIEARLGSK